MKTISKINKAPIMDKEKAHKKFKEVANLFDKKEKLAQKTERRRVVMSESENESKNGYSTGYSDDDK